MKLRHKPTGLEVTVSYPVWRKKFFDDPEWIDITPPLTEKQKQSHDRYRKLGNLHLAKANLTQVVITFGDHYGLFADTLNQINKLIDSINPPKP